MEKGTYALVLHLQKCRHLTIGRLGKFTFETGYYIYAGSALGPGGIRARLGRHIRGSGRIHWHVDYLRRAAVPVAAWFRTDSRNHECEWAAALASSPDLKIPVPGFGCSDCSCLSHLFFINDYSIIKPSLCGPGQDLVYLDENQFVDYLSTIS